MVRVILVDFNKAFESVGNHILLTKCASLGLANFIRKGTAVLVSLL